MACKLKGRLSPRQTLRGRISQQHQTLYGKIVNKGGVITDHNLLNNRDLPNQHPIEAITGLQEALDEKVNRDELAPVALSGDVADLTQSEDGYILFYCGSASDIV